MTAPAEIKLVAPDDQRLQLSNIEKRLIADFRRMSSKSRTCVSGFSTLTADKDAENARKAAPVLHLVREGAR